MSVIVLLVPGLGAGRTVVRGVLHDDCLLVVGCERRAV
jgi:hypothetical protein